MPYLVILLLCFGLWAILAWWIGDPSEGNLAGVISFILHAANFVACIVLFVLVSLAYWIGGK